MASTGPAYAGDGYGYVTCDQRPQAGCDVRATVPASSAAVGVGYAVSKRSVSDGGRVCQNLHGAPTPCYDPQLGWLGNDHCYYKPAATPPTAASQALLGGAGSGPGGWYDSVCPGLPGTGGATQWLPAGAVPGPVVSPATLAQQAASRLGLLDPVVRLSPAGSQLVRVPTWLWIETGTWRPRSASAGVAGLTVTATATPSRVVWAMGDGAGQVTCAGPGTPWREGMNAAAVSPTCGYTYTRSSTSQPGEVYQVTATITWAIAWTGGGAGGVLPAVTTTTAMPVRVQDNQ
ncbi:MAG TPA: hypothetical protein VI248_26825, partial [Kineosporiaceae bacterium]